MSGPGKNKLPMNILLTRQHKANLKRDAFHRGVTMSDIVLELLDEHAKRVKKKYGGLPKPVPVYKAPWVQKRRGPKKAKKKTA